MKRPLRRLALGTIASLTGLLFVLAPASIAAADPPGIQCDANVSDGGQLFGSQLGGVQQAAQKLENSKGAPTVRVITTPGFAEGNFDAYEKNVERACPSWQDANGQRKNNLVVVGISMSGDKAKRALAIYNGSQWNTPLRDNNEWTLIASQAMKPKAQAGDFAGASVAALDRIRADLDAYMGGGSGSGTGSGSGAQQPSTPSVPLDLSWVKWVFISIAAIVGLIVLFMYIGRRKQARDKLQAARQRAVGAKSGASELITQLGNDADRDVLASKANTYGSAGETGAAIRQAYRTFTEQFGAASRQFREAATNGDPDDAHLSLETYEAIREQFDGVRQYAEAALAAKNTLEDLVAQVKAEVDSFPKSPGGGRNAASDRR
jgi:uncharacterized membrane protein YgcG